MDWVGSLCGATIRASLCDANNDGTDELDEDEIIAEEMSNEADDTDYNQMSQMKEQEFVEKSENTRNPSLQVL